MEGETEVEATQGRRNWPGSNLREENGWEGSSAEGPQRPAGDVEKPVA